MSNNLHKRLVAIEQERLAAEIARVEAMTDEELEAFLDEDPVSKGVLDSLTRSELEALAAGTQSAIADFEAKVKAAR